MLKKAKFVEFFFGFEHVSTSKNKLKCLKNNGTFVVSHRFEFLMKQNAINVILYSQTSIIHHPFNSSNSIMHQVRWERAPANTLYMYKKELDERKQ